jgi:thioredoxin-like negative regulator of GroEL
MMAPIYKKMAKEYEGKAVFVKIDTQRNGPLQAKYRVNSIPTFMTFLDGKKKKEFMGAGEQQLRQIVKEVVSESERFCIFWCVHCCCCCCCCLWFVLYFMFILNNENQK